MGKGKDVEKMFEERVKSHGKRACCFRFTDTHDVIGRGGVAPATASDFAVVFEGQMFFAEIKSSANKKKFPKANLKRKSQINAGIRVEAAGGSYYYFIYSIHLKEWFWIPFNEVATRKDWRWESLPKLLWI